MIIILAATLPYFRFNASVDQKQKRIFLLGTAIFIARTVIKGIRFFDRLFWTKIMWKYFVSKMDKKITAVSNMILVICCSKVLLPVCYILGNYSCLVAQFHMKRSISFHLIQSYLPSILIVAISWVSFWMDIDCVPARVTLGVITLLTVSGLVSGKGV